MTLISRFIFFEEQKLFPNSKEKVVIDNISIVIPVKDNQKGIDLFLSEFIAIHTEMATPKEVIIVDNNSSPPIHIASTFLDNVDKLKLIKCLKPGPASARNAGARQAKGKWLLFLDSDCIPTEHLLSGYLNAPEGAIAYAGNVKSMGTDWLSQYYETQEILVPLKTKNVKNRFVPQYLITANCLVLKSAFDEVSGFNESITIAGGEDIDLGLRLSQIGRLEFAFDSIALHNFDDGLIGFAKRFIRYGVGNRIIEKLYNVKMKPIPFKPNRTTIINNLLARLQFLFLYLGYINAK